MCVQNVLKQVHMQPNVNQHTVTLHPHEKAVDSVVRHVCQAQQRSRRVQHWYGRPLEHAGNDDCLSHSTGTTRTQWQQHALMMVLKRDDVQVR